MKVYHLPDQVRGLLFDVDATLYTHPEYAQVQIDDLIRRLAARRGLGYDDMRRQVEDYRRDWAEAQGGKKTSLGNAFVHFGVSIEESVRWREELVDPSKYLRPDPELRRTLQALSAHAALAVVTNNAVLTGRRTLRALGVEDLFSVVIGLDSCGVSKPHAQPYLAAAAGLGVDPPACVSIGDRYDIDLALPLELGMGGILVDGVEDVYRLPEVLFSLDGSRTSMQP